MAEVKGTPFGRYRLIELLARGGMGEVWRAYDPAIDRVVALKVLHADFADDPVFQERFRREARAAAGLDEPHVVPIHDFGEIEGRLYVTMRLIKGRDLQAILHDRPLSPERAVRIIEQVAKALHAAHKVGLVHRDIKPSNILLDDDDFAYLIDFGIARAAGETGLTSTGATVGTWSYMAPERFRSGTADARADIYALACVLYESLTGQPPFAAGSLEQIAVAHMLQPPPRPSTRVRGVSARMDDVIATGMAKIPDQRHATTVELARAARDAITVPLARPRPSAPVHPPSRPDQRTAASFHGQDTRPAAAGAAPVLRPSAGMPPPSAPHQVGKRHRIAFVAAFLSTFAVITAVTIVIIVLQHDTGEPSAGSNTRISSQSPRSNPQISSQSRTTASSPVVAPVTEAQLDGLLLDPAAINSAMHASGLTVLGTNDSMYSGSIADRNCLAILNPTVDQVYYGTGWAGVRAQALREPANWTHVVGQSVVVFGSANAAAAFYSASSPSWSACSNRQFTNTTPGANNVVWSVGPVSDQNGMLSVSATQLDLPTWTHQRALTVRNNVVIDVVAESFSPHSQLAVAIAEQIAAKVPE
jgi:serine/threonine-protein kinase